MSISSVSSIGSSSSSSTSSSTQSQLSEDTIKKLKELGLDPTQYKTEAQAQAAISSAQQATQKPQNGANSYDTIKTEVTDLASQMGVEVGNNDKLDDILDKISTQINVLQASAGDDTEKLADVNNYQSEYAQISSELSQLEAARNMKGASALANYNKAALGLAA